MADRHLRRSQHGTYQPLIIGNQRSLGNKSLSQNIRLKTLETLTPWI